MSVVVGRPVWIGSKPIATLAPNPSITYTNGFTGLTFQQISKLAWAVSDNAGITHGNCAECWVTGAGLTPRHISIGDTFNATVDGRTHTCRLMDFNYYNLMTSAGQSYPGGPTATGKCGLLFQTVELITTQFRGNQLSGIFFPGVTVEPDLYAVLKYDRTTFVPTYGEVVSYIAGNRFRWYADHPNNADRVKHPATDVTAQEWWLNAVYYSEELEDYRCWYVKANGSLDRYGYAGSGGPMKHIAPCFCI